MNLLAYDHIKWFLYNLHGQYQKKMVDFLIIEK